jgi:hypothetical protein
VWGTGVLVECLLEHGSADALAEAHDAVDGLATRWAADGSTMFDITMLRLRALLARARGDDDHRELAARYRDVAAQHGFEGHVAWAEDLT